MRMQVGQALRKARLQRGIDLYEVQRVTKVRVQTLRAMEEDRWDAVPAAEAEADLSAYARFLGVDESELIEQYKPTVDADEPAEAVPGVIEPGGRAHTPGRTRVVLAVIGFAAVVGVIIGIFAVGGSNNSGQGGIETTGGTTTVTTPNPSPVSVMFQTKKLVWVCLVDQRRRPVINAQNLLAGQTVGPYNGKSFEVTFGNGSVDLTVNGQPVDVPGIAAPLGYRITPDGATRLGPADDPTCT